MLESAAGEQTAVPGSYCVSDPTRGVGACGDTEPLEPERMSVVRPGEQLALRLRDATTTSGSITVSRLGCDAEPVREVPLTAGSETRWAADLPPGAYRLDVSASFEEPDGRSGDVSGVLAILVDAAAPQKILPVPLNIRGC